MNVKDEPESEPAPEPAPEPVYLFILHPDLAGSVALGPGFWICVVVLVG
jgi:hypothetical protein